MTRTFWRNLAILFALFAHRRFCLRGLYVAIAHMMYIVFVVFFFGVKARLYTARTRKWCERESGVREKTVIIK